MTEARRPAKRELQLDEEPGCFLCQEMMDTVYVMEEEPTTCDRFKAARGPGPISNVRALTGLLYRATGRSNTC